jgi:hypothetical protein
MGAVVGEGRERTGSVIGIKVTEKGSKYDFPPFIEISDDCDQGYGAVARAIINDNGEIESIYMVSEGENYPVGELDPYYVEDIDIVESGQDYTQGDYAIDQFDNRYNLIVDNGIIVGATPINIITVVDPISNVVIVPTTPLTNNRIVGGNERKIEQIIRVDDIPELTVISENGFGAILTPRLDIVPSKVDESGNYIVKPVTQIDCIS